ncbi:hypothetical protein VPH35_012796 [Triticum aestivum]
MQVVLARKSRVQFGLIVDRVLVEHKSMECRTRIAVFWYEKEGYSAIISIRSILEEHLMSPPSSPEEEAPSLPEVQEHWSSTAMSPASSTSEVPKASGRTQKIDDIAEMNIAEDLDNRPSKKAKNSETGVLEPSPTMSVSSPISECFESIVPESVLPLHDVKEPDSNKEIIVEEKYDYLPQGICLIYSVYFCIQYIIKVFDFFADNTLTDHDLCAHIAIESPFRKQLLVQIDGSSVLQNQLMCLLDEKEWVNDDVINAYICCMKDQIHVQNDNKCVATLH